VLKNLGNYSEAKALLEKAMRSNEVDFGKNHPTTAISYLNFAALYVKLKDYENAFLYIQKTFAVFEPHLGLNHPYTQNALSWLNLIKNEMLKNGYTMEQIQAFLKA
jgi:tetratricopeptide (TPR) repeat protein